MLGSDRSRSRLGALAAAALLALGPTAACASETKAPAPAPQSAASEGPKVTDRVVIELAKGGEIHLDLYGEAAPGTVANFLKLVDKGFYNGLSFHRVVPGFVVQGGDPSGNGTGGPGWTIKLERSGIKHREGSLAMARKPDPDSAGSQFYIAFGPQPHLDGQYCVFGQVAEGMDRVRAIARGDVMKKVRRK